MLYVCYVIVKCVDVILVMWNSIVLVSDHFLPFYVALLLQQNDCPCSNCKEYLESLQERVTDKPTTNQEIDKLTTTVPRVSTTKREGWSVEDRHSDGSVTTDKKAKQKGCGLQIING